MKFSDDEIMGKSEEFMERQMIDLSDKLEGYENYVTQDLSGEIYKWEYMPEKGDSEWFKNTEESGSNTWCVSFARIYSPNWEGSLVDLSTHAPWLINGVLTAVPKLMIPTTKSGELPYGARKKQTTDVVNKPEHYRQGDIECIDAIKSATTHKLGIAAVCVANVIKYLWRYESKNGLEDVKKAQWYLNKLVMEIEKNKLFSVEENGNG